MRIPESGKPNPRADSYSLYLNYVANQVLINLLPKARLNSKLQKTVRAARKNKASNNNEA